MAIAKTKATHIYNAMKKVCFVHNDFPFGGAERVTIDIARMLAKDGNHEIYVITRKHYADKMPADYATCPYFKVIEATAGTSKDNYKFVVSTAKELGLTSMVYVGHLFTEAVPELQQMGCKTIYANHGAAFWEITNKRANALNSRNKGVLKALEYYLLRYPRYNIMHTLEPKYEKMYKEDVATFDAYTVLCNGYKEQISTRLSLSAAESDKIHVIPNMQLPAAEVCYDKQKEFLFVGRLSYADKRVDRLIEAWRIAEQQLPDWRLTIVGDGPELPRLKQRAKGLHGVSFEGYQKPEPYYKRASALCLVSEFEGFPLCLVEAQAQGVVPIAMNCTEGVATIINPNGINGMLVENGNIEAFAQKMLEFAALSDDERLKLRHNVVNKSLEYSPQRVAAEWDKVLA